MREEQRTQIEANLHLFKAHVLESVGEEGDDVLELILRNGKRDVVERHDGL